MIFDDLEIHPEAGAELEAAVDTYLVYSPDSAQRFIDRVRKLLKDLWEWPRSGRKWEPWDRDPQVFSYGVKGYPFRIVYFLRHDEPVVVACAHERRLPGYWKHRLDD